MLPKQKRLRTLDFKAKESKPLYRGPLFDIRIVAADETRFGCIISKKRIKRAVDRNRAKRKVYAGLTHLHLASTFLVFIYPTQAVLKAPHTLLQEELRKAFATLS
ncbi:MAG: Ribonuclease [Candidatus Parcubacteria bacterium]|jgi:ribonuclease P protein component